MRFLVDANLSPIVATLLNEAGHDAVAVRDFGLQDAGDETILERPPDDDRVIVSHDADFGTLLAVQRRSTPSSILIRSADPLTTTELTALIIDNLDVMFEDLTARSDDHVRTPPSPITPTAGRAASNLERTCLVSRRSRANYRSKRRLEDGLRSGPGAGHERTARIASRSGIRADATPHSWTPPQPQPQRPCRGAQEPTVPAVAASREGPNGLRPRQGPIAEHT